MSKHDVRFPNESKDYRSKRDELLDSEMELRRQLEAVAAKRRQLPLGGEVPKDYVFDAPDGRKVPMSQMFRDGKDELIIYSFMYGPKMDAACPA